MVSILIRWKMALERYTLREIFDKCNSMGTVKFGNLVGEDHYGNKYYEDMNEQHGQHRSVAVDGSRDGEVAETSARLAEAFCLYGSRADGSSTRTSGTTTPRWCRRRGTDGFTTCMTSPATRLSRGWRKSRR